MNGDSYLRTGPGLGYDRTGKVLHRGESATYLGSTSVDSRGVAYVSRPIKEERPAAEELKKWQAMSGLPLKKFFNTSGLLYKSLHLKDRLPAMTEEEQLELLASDGMLVKRPLVIGEDFVLVGFKEAQWEETLLRG